MVTSVRGTTVSDGSVDGLAGLRTVLDSFHPHRDSTHEDNVKTVALKIACQHFFQKRPLLGPRQ